MKYFYALGLIAAFIAIMFATTHEDPLTEIMLYSTMGLVCSAMLKIEELEERIKKIGA